LVNFVGEINELGFNGDHFYGLNMMLGDLCHNWLHICLDPILDEYTELESAHLEQ